MPARLQSVRHKIVLIALLTTAVALTVASIALLLYETNTYRRVSRDDMLAQSEIIAKTTASALAFEDRGAASENLSALRSRRRIQVAAIYTPEGQLFATYRSPGFDEYLFPPLLTQDGYEFRGQDLLLFYPVKQGSETLGVVFVLARLALWDRLLGYFAILVVVMAISLAAAVLISLRLQRTLTRPILDVAGVARKVIEDRDFSLRVQRTTNDEIGTLVDAFNSMLAEVGAQARALRAADQRKDEFLATLAHELRNPLAPMVNALAILKAPASNARMTQQAREMIARQLAQMVRLVDDLLDVSRITTGKLVVRREPVELALIARNAVETVRPLIETRQHELIVTPPEYPVIVDGDATRLAQVFSNLLNNAAKYTQGSGQIWFGAEIQGGEVLVTVRDSGIGIQPEMLPQIFQMFTQVDASIERANSGLGVGLALAKQLVELHGGTLTAYSAGLGEGSAFSVRLPMLSVSAPLAHAQAPVEAERSTGRRILLVDDNVDYALSLATLLETLGHDVRVAHEGASALRMVSAEGGRFEPQFAFLDIGMPGMNGYELAARLRADAALAGITLVAITGWGQEDDRRRARVAGFDHHLVKPVEFDVIEALLGVPEPV